jgi:hypothetical protein
MDGYGRVIAVIEIHNAAIGLQTSVHRAQLVAMRSM